MTGDRKWCWGAVKQGSTTFHSYIRGKQGLINLWNIYIVWWWGGGRGGVDIPLISSKMNYILTLVNAGYFFEEITKGGGAQTSAPPKIPFIS